MCQLYWQTDETVADIVNTYEVAGKFSVLKTWGKRMREGSGKYSYKSRKAHFKGDKMWITIRQKLAILDEVKQPNVVIKDVLAKHGVARSTFGEWRKKERSGEAR